METDVLQRFVFDKTDVRGEIVRLNHSFATIMQQHHYPKIIFDLLAKTLAASVLMSAALKYEGQFTVQLQGKQAIKLLVAKCTQDLHIRGLAQFDEALLAKPNNLLSGGELVVTVESEQLIKPYQSIIPLYSDNLSQNLEHYFNQSVQVPTKIFLAVNQHSATGMLLQLLPHQQQTLAEREIFWQHIIQLAETITEEELLNLSNEETLYRLYHAENPRLFTPEPIEFRCNCSKTRMDNVVRMLGKQETDEIFATKQMLDITCEYCNTVYSYSRNDVAGILQSEN